MENQTIFYYFLYKLEAEAVPEVSEKYEITSVPTFLFFKVSFFWLAYMHECPLVARKCSQQYALLFPMKVRRKLCNVWLI